MDAGEAYPAELIDSLRAGPVELFLCTKDSFVFDALRCFVFDESCPEEEEEEPVIHIEPKLKNLIVLPKNQDFAARQLASFCPEFVAPIIRVRRPRAQNIVSGDSISRDVLDESEQLIPLPKGYERAVLVLRPYAYNFYRHDIISRIKEAGFTIVLEKELMLGVDQAKQYYADKSEELYFNQLIDLMTSNPIYALLLIKENGISKLRKLLGPTDPVEACTDHPESLRGLYAMPARPSQPSVGAAGISILPTTSSSALIDGDDDEVEKESQPKEEVVESGKEEEPPLPEAIDQTSEQDKTDGPATTNEETGEEKNEGESTEHAETEKQPQLESSSSDQSIKDDEDDGQSSDQQKTKRQSQPAIKLPTYLFNTIHGSDSAEGAEKDSHTFFPVELTIGAIKPDAYPLRDEIIDRAKEANFVVVNKKSVQLNEEMASQLYVNSQHRPYFSELITAVTSGPTIFIQLKRQDAIRSWRTLMGKTNPDEAAEQAEDRNDPMAMNLRATYGRSVLENAVFGCKNAADVERVAELIFTEPVIETEPEQTDLNQESFESQEDAGLEEGQEASPEGTTEGTETAAAESKSGEEGSKDANKETPSAAESTLQQEGSIAPESKETIPTDQKSNKSKSSSKSSKSEC